jgi:hypothetical protein
MRSLLIAGVTLAAVTGCDGGGDDDLPRAAQVYVASIRHALSDQPPPRDPDALPVVYVVAVGESSIPAAVQAEVAGLLRDESEVRFADEREEAILADVPTAPVRDDGTLVAIGDVPTDDGSIDVPVELYRSAEDWSKEVLTVEERADRWAVTSTSVLP